MCNGENGTPNLQNNFVVGAGDSYAVDAVGGNINHNHDFTGDGHIHFNLAGVDIKGGVGKTYIADPTSITGTTDNENGLPPYHSLAYIMEL